MAYIPLVTGYTLILINSLLKWVDALVLLSVIYSLPGTCDKKLIILPPYSSFDEVSLKSK